MYAKSKTRSLCAFLVFVLPLLYLCACWLLYFQNIVLYRDGDVLLCLVDCQVDVNIVPLITPTMFRGYNFIYDNLQCYLFAIIIVIIVTLIVQVVIVVVVLKTLLFIFTFYYSLYLY